MCGCRRLDAVPAQLASERRSVASDRFTPEHDPRREPERPDSPFDPRSLRQATNIATSALVIARMLISMIPKMNCTTQPI